jgi:hypothetical protein
VRGSHAQADRLQHHVARRVRHRAGRERHGHADGRVLRRVQPRPAADRRHAAAGGTTYRGLKSYWPGVAENPSVSPAVTLDPGVADLHREIGQRNNEYRKVVVSDSLSKDDTDVPTFRSRTLWTDPLAAWLIDELHLMVGPVAAAAASRRSGMVGCRRCGCSTRSVGRDRKTWSCGTRSSTADTSGGTADRGAPATQTLKLRPLRPPGAVALNRQDRHGLGQ